MHLSPALPAALLLVACGPKAPRRAVNVAPTLPTDDAADGAGVSRPLGRWHELRGTSPDPGPTFDGAPQWRVEVDGPVLASLETDGVVAWVVVNGRVLALQSDGTVLWDTDLRATTAVLATDEGPAVGTSDGVVAVLEPSDGSTRRAYPAGGELAGPPVVVDGGLAWVTTAGHVVSADGWLVEAADSAVGGSASDGEALYFSTRAGELVAVGRDGVRWRVELPGRGIGHPVTDGQLVLATYGAGPGHSGGVMAVTVGTGTEQWRWGIGFEPAAPPAWGGAIYVADMGGELRALDPESGAEIWRTAGQTAFSATPRATPFSIYAVEVTGRVTRLDPDDGGEIWVTDLASAITASPAVVGERLIVGLANGQVIGLGTPTP